MYPEKYRKLVSAARWSAQGKVFWELLNSSPRQLCLFKPLLLFILQQSHLDRFLGDTGSDHRTDGVLCLSENREARQQQIA